MQRANSTVQHISNSVGPTHCLLRCSLGLYKTGVIAKRASRTVQKRQRCTLCIPLVLGDTIQWYHSMVFFDGTLQLHYSIAPFNCFLKGTIESAVDFSVYWEYSPVNSNVSSSMLWSPQCAHSARQTLVEPNDLDTKFTLSSLSLIYQRIHRVALSIKL